MAPKKTGFFARAWERVKKVPLRTWLIGAFVVLFLVWFVPRAGMFAKIAGALGIGAALAYLAPFLLPLIAGLLGGVAAAIAAAISAFRKRLKEGGTVDDAKNVAESAQEEVEDTLKELDLDSTEKAEANQRGVDRAQEVMEGEENDPESEDYVPADGVGTEVSDVLPPGE